MLPLASYNLPSRAPQRIVNCYPQPLPDRKGVELVGAPGVVTSHDLSGFGRGLHVMRGQLYAVAGGTLYKVNQAGYTSLGTVTGAGILTMADNGTQLVTDTGFLYNGSTVSSITDADKVPWEAVDFCDGYIVAVESDSGRFVCSALNDATSWDGLDFATAEGAPDDLVTLIVDHRQVILFGTASVEVWYNSGSSGFPFERLAGGFIEIGCLAKRGVCKADNSVFWLASDRTIRRLSGATPLRVSQHGIEERISRMAVVSDCTAFSYTWEGHILVVFRFPVEGECFVYNATLNEWHERESYAQNGWDVVDAAEAYGRIYVQHVDGTVGYLSDTEYQEFGNILRREWTYQTIYDNGRRLFHGGLELILRTGDAPLGVTPYVHLEYSDDGGNIWTHLPRRELGTQGQYSKRIRWSALGSAHDRVYRMSVDAPVPFHVTDTILQVS